MSKWSEYIDYIRRKGRSRECRRRIYALIKRSDGFTLIESLIVLSIFLVISSVLLFGFKPQLLYLEKQRFFNQLKADLYYGQQYAISHQHEVYVFIIPDQTMYYLRGKDSRVILIRREIPKEITIMEGSQQLFFQFQPDGNINKFGSINIFIGKEKYRLTFLIGKGRFYVAKE